MSESTGLEWFKSSYNGSDDGNYREMAPKPTTSHIRDSKALGRGRLTVTPTTWSAFLSPPRIATPEGS
ncbi:hypothetical protein GCM10009837_68510 [Streptomyces durmitorensis]|uniref:DUF397 domain-containing protein n=1 Tax=Streptomyces durmitorensis TaxID=319947 RepID=A0ABY4PJU3_9ACTN|nr:DUF397 domain-containing protein [Streptomyces durmitorensis]UQT53617.1 DUF397 domain-containing protein [Streptomyces durmitorensis]